MVECRDWDMTVVASFILAESSQRSRNRRIFTFPDLLLVDRADERRNVQRKNGEVRCLHEYGIG